MIEKLGHYKIVSELGRGGMGVVYKAYEESLNRYVAIKVLGEHLGHDENFVKRFVREAKAAAGLSHPNVIQIFFIGHEAPTTPNGTDGRHYFVMEFVEGRSVHDLLKEEGALDPLRAVRIVQQAASGLAVAHDQGLVHRDIKPANLLVTRDERVKIADFGLALAPTDGATRLTATNSLMGTPGYLSPEQCCGEPAGSRSDIYSLGMTFYEMLTGTMPFRGESPLAVLRQILDEEPPKLLEVDPDLDPRIASVVERMVAKEPNDRYQTCHELIADLNAILGLSTAGTATAGGARAAGLPPVPPPPPISTSARTHMKVTGRPEEAPTQAAPKRAPAPQQPVAAGAPPPPPGAPQAGAAPPPAPRAAVSPVVAAGGTAKSGSGGKWLLIGAMAVMLIVAVSAAGLYFAAPMLKDAPFLRDAPFFKNASLLEDEDGATHIVDESAIAAGTSSPSTTSSAAADGAQDGRFDTKMPPSGDADIGTSESAAATLAQGSEPAASGGTSSSPAGSSNASDAGTKAEPAGANKSGAAPRTASQSSAAGSGSVRSLAGSAEPAAQPRGQNVASRETALEPAAPPRRAPIREQPRVAVIAVGEPLFASAAEEALESQLARHGIDLYDERGILELRDAGSASQVAPSSLLGMVSGRGVDVMVLIDVQPMGQRDLDALGRYAYATTARVRVDAYLAADGDAIGRGWSQQVEYAEPNAERKADGAMGDVSTGIAESIDAAWQDFRSGAR